MVSKNVGMHTHCVVFAYLYCFCAHNNATTRDHKNSTTRDMTFQARIWLRKPYQLLTSKTEACLCKIYQLVLFAHTSQLHGITDIGNHTHCVMFADEYCFVCSHNNSNQLNHAEHAHLHATNSTARRLSLCDHCQTTKRVRM